jgi:hypothetical protein
MFRNAWETVMKRSFVVGLVAALAVAGIWFASRGAARPSRTIRPDGTMEAVDVAAKGPSLVLPTVWVSAERHLAAADGRLNAY